MGQLWGLVWASYGVSRGSIRPRDHTKPKGRENLEGILSSNYATGVRFEREFKHDLESLGYEVTRAAGSKSPFDLVAIKYTRNRKQVAWIALVQCKTSKVRDA